MLRVQLLETENTELIEGNWWGDKFWGVYNDVGLNMLGKLLMLVREEMKDDKVISKYKQYITDKW